MSDGIKVCLKFTMLAFMFISLALPIAELVFAGRYEHQSSRPDCANDRVIDPAKWLLVSGIIGIISIVLMFGSTILTIATENGAFLIITLTVSILVGMFNLAWVIVGSVMLWRDNVDCHPEEFKSMLWASVIIHLIGVAGSVFRNTCTTRVTVE